MNDTDDNGKGSHGKDDITLTVVTAKGTFTADFGKNSKVADVIEVVVKKENLGGQPSDFELFKDEQALTPTTRTLVSFHLEDGDKLTLSQTYHLIVNRQPKDWKSEVITGADIRNLSGSPEDWVVNQIVDGPGEDPEVAPLQEVHLALDAAPVGEKKFTVRKPKTAPGA